MKAIFLLILTGVSLSISVRANDLTREEALKIGHDNNGAKNGEFWFEHGDSSPPFVHSANIIISRGSQVHLAWSGDDSGVGVDAPYDDGSETRLDFFTSSKGHGWITAHVLKPEIVSTRPEPPRDQRPPTHIALSPAAELAIHEGDLDFLKVLMKRGLKVNEALDFQRGNTLLHEAISARNLEIGKFLLTKGASPETRSRYGERPIDQAINAKQKDFCNLLAKPRGDENKIDGIPTGLIQEVLPHNSMNEIVFVSWNNQDPSADVLMEICKSIPDARVKSKMETIDRRPLGARSWYRDKETHEFGTLIEVDLHEVKDYWTATVRESVGPVMAGGGQKCNIRKVYGYWHTYDVEGWDE